MSTNFFVTSQLCRDVTLGTDALLLQYHIVFSGQTVPQEMGDHMQSGM